MTCTDTPATTEATKPRRSPQTAIRSAIGSRAPSLAHLIRRKLAIVAASTAAFALAYITLTHLHTPPAVVESPATSSPADDRAAELLGIHNCWTDNAPEGVIPGHVVVTFAGDAYPTYAGEKATGWALEQLFGDADYGMTIHGFCAGDGVGGLVAAVGGAAVGSPFETGAETGAVLGLEEG